MTRPIVTVFDGSAIDELLSRKKGSLLECAGDEPPTADRTGLLDLGTEHLFAEEQPNVEPTAIEYAKNWLLIVVMMASGSGSGVLWHVYSPQVWEILRRWQHWIWPRLCLWLL